MYKRQVLKKGESQRKDGTYDYRWTSKNGKRHSIYAQTLEELRIKEEVVVRDEMDGIRAEARCTTLNELFEVWAQVKRGLKDNTYQNYLYVYRQFVAPDFGQSRISSIKKTDIKRFYNMLADQRGLKISTIESVHTVLHQVLTTAVEDNYLRSNPSDNVLRELKKEKEFETVKRKALTISEQNIFLNYLKKTPKYQHWYPIFAVMMGTGLRVGEATGLRWCDIDLQERTISVNHTLVNYDHRETEGRKGCYFNCHSPKTEAGKRMVPMIETVREAFLLERAYQKEAVKKSKKLLKFTLDDGTGTDRVILSGIHAYYEPEELVGKTCIAIVNLPPRPMMGIDSCGMLISAVHHENGEEKLHLLMVDDHIPAGAKLY